MVSGDILLPEVIVSNTQLTVSLNEQCSSTQLDAKLGIEAHQEGKALYLANSQSAGKGRFGRDYYCPRSRGHLHVPSSQASTATCGAPPYTLMLAGAIYKAIKNLTLIDIDIKWVNDIYYRHKKLGESLPKLSRRSRLVLSQMSLSESVSI